MCCDEIICPDNEESLHPIDLTQLKLSEYDIVDTIVDWEQFKKSRALPPTILQELIDDAKEVMDQKFNSVCETGNIREVRDICNSDWFEKLLTSQPAEVEK